MLRVRMQCAPLGKAYKPAPGADKWRLRPDHSLEVLYPEYADIGAGGWRNKACAASLRWAHLLLLPDHALLGLALALT
jgi:hypothetical protein